MQTFLSAHRIGFVAALALAMAAPITAQEKLPPGAKVIRLEAQPTSIVLKHRYAYTQLLVTGQLDNGDRVDLTRLVKIDRPAAVTITPAGLVRAAADGTGALKLAYGGQSLSVPVQVSGTREKYAANYVRDVMPVMSKLGCNAGTCHGAQGGKNGFKLSLRGYDPLYDHQALTDEIGGRRFNRAAPENSLMLLKPAGAVPHVGGVLMQPGDPAYDLIRDWIADGVKLDLKTPRVTRIEIFPKNPVVPLPGMKQQMAVVATYADGLIRDVSAEAFIETSNQDVATVDKTGLVTAARRGEAAMLARYEGAYTATPLIVMGDRSGFVWQQPPSNNFIDTLVYEKLKSVKVPPSGLCTDAEFIRRIYLDLTGLPPETEAVRAFVADKRDSRVKREELVDKLVGSPDYVEHWTNKWADLLQVNRTFLGEKGATALRAAIRQAVATNKPYDQFVHDVLTGSGSNVENPWASYYKVLRDPGTTMENTTQLFLAVRFNCNKCHDHPFERWTQDQYYHLAAYFAQVARKEDPAYRGQKIGGSAVEGAVPLVEVVYDQKSGDVKHDRTGQVTPPEFPYQKELSAATAASRREQLAAWITSKNNQYFARSYVNRLWAYLLGVGIIEPIDDIRAGNPPSNPKLLDRLTEEFLAHRFDVQHMVRLICKSRVYQHSLETNALNKDDDINYSHALARRLPAEVLYDAIHRATGSVPQLPGLPAGSRAAQLLDSNVEVPGGFLNLFGRPPRQSACECERSSGTILLGPVLNLVNGPVVNDAIKDPNNRINRLAGSIKDDGKLIEELFLAIVNRPPTAQELELCKRALSGQQQEYDRLMAESNRRAKALADYQAQLPAKQAEWEKQIGSQVITWTPIEVESATANGGATLTKQPDGSYVAGGKNPPTAQYKLAAKAKLANITGVRLEVLTDSSLPATGPGRAPNGNFVLNEFRVTTGPEGARARPIPLARAFADFSQAGFDVGGIIDNNLATGWAISPQLGRPHQAVVELKAPFKNADQPTITFNLDMRFGTEHTIGKLRIAVTDSPLPLSRAALPEAVVKALAVPTDKRTPAQKDELARYYLTLDQELPKLQQAVNELPKPADPRALGVQDLAWALINSKEFLFNH